MAEAPLAPAPGPAKPAGWSLRWRVASGLAFVPLLILLARAGGLTFVGFVALQVTLGLLEFYRMMRGKGLDPDARLGVPAALGVLWVAYVTVESVLVGMRRRGTHLPV